MRECSADHGDELPARAVLVEHHAGTPKRTTQPARPSEYAPPELTRTQSLFAGMCVVRRCSRRLGAIVLLLVASCLVLLAATAHAGDSWYRTDPHVHSTTS